MAAKTDTQTVQHLTKTQFLVAFWHALGASSGGGGRLGTHSLSTDDDPGGGAAGGYGRGTPLPKGLGTSEADVGRQSDRATVDNAYVERNAIHLFRAHLVGASSYGQNQLRG